MIAYKVMREFNGQLLSLADKKSRHLARVGSQIKMKGEGVYLSTNKDFVLNFYSGNSDDYEVLVQVMYSPSEIIKGNDTDIENVFTVPQCRILHITQLES
jgi:hypothetical protein